MQPEAADFFPSCAMQILPTATSEKKNESAKRNEVANVGRTTYLMDMSASPWTSRYGDDPKVPLLAYKYSMAQRLTRKNTPIGPEHLHKQC